MNKWHRILIITLLVQLALGAFVFWPRPAASSGGQPLLGALKASDIAALTITDDKGVSTKLAKQGDKWVAPEVASYPADAAKVTPVLDKLVGIKAGRPVAQTAASQTQLQVADNKFARKIDLAKADGSSQTLYLGSSAGGQAVHVRLAGENDVYLASGVATYEVNGDLLSWIDPVYLSLNANDITSFTLKNKNGEFPLTKDANSGWQLAGLASGETLDANKATNLVTSLAGLRMTAPLGKTEDPAWGLQQPSAVVTIQVKNGDQTKTVTLTVGTQDATDKSYVVKSSESEYYARVAESSVQDLVSHDRAAFLTATPTPATAPQPGVTPAP